MVRKLSAGELVTFGPSIADDETVSNLASQWAKMLSALPFSPATDWEAFREYTAEETTRRQCQLFDRIVAPQAAAATAFAFDNR